MHNFNEFMFGFDEKIPLMTFSEILREARIRVGLIQYRVAQHLKFELGRLRNLETGYFRTIPAQEEIDALASFYGVSRDELQRKAELHVKQRKLAKQHPRDIHEKMHSMQTNKK